MLFERSTAIWQGQTPTRRANLLPKRTTRSQRPLLLEIVLKLRFVAILLAILCFNIHFAKLDRPLFLVCCCSLTDIDYKRSARLYIIIMIFNISLSLGTYLLNDKLLWSISSMIMCLYARYYLLANYQQCLLNCVAIHKSLIHFIIWAFVWGDWNGQ